MSTGMEAEGARGQSAGAAGSVEGRGGSKSVRKWTASTKSRWVASITKSMALKFSSRRKQRPRLVWGLKAGQGLTATRADEREAPFAAFAGPVQMFGDDPFQGNLVAQTIQQVAREVLGHGIVLSRSHEGPWGAALGQVTELQGSVSW